MSEQSITARSLLDQILGIGREYLEKGQDLAEQKLNIPESGEQRELMLNGLKTGAIASAVLVGLLGTKGGRKITGAALKIGSLAALGTAAFKGYQHWQKNSQVEGDESVTAVHELDNSASVDRSYLLINALICAANADGKIDDAEQQAIKHQILEMHLSNDLADKLESMIDSPLDVQSLAAQVSDLEAASEVYLASRLLIGKESSVTEQMYLEQLTEALGLSNDLIESLELQVA